MLRVLQKELHGQLTENQISEKFFSVFSEVIKTAMKRLQSTMKTISDSDDLDDGADHDKCRLMKYYIVASLVFVCRYAACII